MHEELYNSYCRARTWCDGNPLWHERFKEARATWRNSYEIANLASSIKSKKNEVVAFGIILRKDRFRAKPKETNESLLAICGSRNIPFINHGNIDTRTHINRRGLHLTTRWSKIVGDIVKFTKNLLFTKWRFDYMGISHSNMNRNCKPIIKTIQVKS